MANRQKQIEDILVAYGKMALGQGARPNYSRKQKKAIRLWDEAERLESQLAESLYIPASSKQYFRDDLSNRAWVEKKAMDVASSGTARPVGRLAERNLMWSAYGAAHGFQWNVMYYFDRVKKLRAKAKKLCPQISAHYRTLTEPLLAEESRRQGDRLDYRKEEETPPPTLTEERTPPVSHGLVPGQSYSLPSGKKVAAILGRNNWFFLSDEQKPATVYWFNKDGALVENALGSGINNPTGWTAGDLKPTENPESHELKCISLHEGSESFELRPGCLALDNLTGRQELVLGISRKDRQSVSTGRGEPPPHQKDSDKLVLVIRLDCDRRSGYRYPSEVSPASSP